MKVLLITHGYPPDVRVSGSATYTADLATCLAEAGTEVSVVSFGGYDTREHVTDRGIDVIRLSTSRGFWRYASGLFSLVRLPQFGQRVLNAVRVAYHVAVSKPDLVETPESRAASLLLGRLRRMPPFVVQVHCPWETTDALNGIPITLDRRLCYWLDRSAARRAPRVVVPSRLMVEQLDTLGWAVPPEVIRISPQVFGPAGWENVSAAPANGLPVVLFVGRGEPTKGIDVLHAACVELSRRGMLFELVVAGPVSTALADLFASAPYAVTHGVVARHDLKAMIWSARVVVLPSRFDNAPMSILEAMASGRPVIVSDRVGLASEISEAGAGRVVPTEDPLSLADAMAVYLGDPDRAQSDGAAGLAYIKETYTEGQVAECRLQIYGELMRN